MFRRQPILTLPHCVIISPHYNKRKKRTELEIEKTILTNAVLFRLVALLTMSKLVASQTTFVESKIADDYDEDCGGTGGQRIYDQKSAVEFLGDGA